MFKTTLYVQVRPDRFIVRKVGDGQTIDRMAPQPFSHPRTLLHPLETIDGGLTQIEERAFQELAIGAGASKVKVWSGPALSDAQVVEKLK